MAGLTNVDGVLRAIGTARSVELSSYLLRRGSPIVGSLAGAARRGAAVHVWADGNPYGEHGDAIGKETRAAARELRKAGVQVDVVTGRRVHLKAAVVDGRAYLDDRNWTVGGHDTVLEVDDAREVGMIRGAIERGAGACDGPLATDRADALQLERDVIDRASDRVDVESESFGPSPGPYAELKARALGGAHVRLIVSDGPLRNDAHGTEHVALRALARAGVEVRVGASRSGTGNEKLCVAGDAAWAGSVNVSYGDPHDAEWGLETRDPSIVAALRNRFEANWLASRPYVAA